ncbi:general amino acid permease Agp2p [[Candida] railenensis]|uniref:General amino acid permease Agp2p n=1 Tax=[Candida] railenensis TaxID=45579 RepID=A0A9P0QM65_9ASCO|nr:general amino acid permease Agp2p [[Candida] railenensis]
MGKLTDFLHENFVPIIPPKQTKMVIDKRTNLVVAASNEKKLSQNYGDTAKAKDASPSGLDNDADEKESIYSTSTEDNYNVLHRSLRGRHVQLLGIGATIGSALFVAIGKALAKGGPLSLLLAFTIWSIPILCITISTAEYVTYLPITSPFVRMAGRCCDSALEVMTAWNFWFLCCAQIPFEVTTVNSIIHFWRDDFSPAIPLCIQTVLYFVINVFGVAIYGETEFWLSIGKVILASGLIIFTFITMVGGNPEHDVYGFRYWKDPGVMNTYWSTGDLGRFQGFLACLIQACFTFAGPEYISSVASETVNPRKTLPSAFKQVFIRLSIFFLGGAFCVGTLVAYNDPKLVETLGASVPGAGGSPYVIAMQNLKIKVLPHIVNGLLVTSAFSAGNSYTYCSSRTLYGVALDGYAPRFLTATTKTGIPIYCMLISLCWALLSFLQLGEGASTVLTWIINLITSCQLINFTILCVVYVFFYRALEAQNISRDTLPFKGWYQPWLAIFGGVCSFCMIFISSYEVFLPGNWDIQTFLFQYLFIFIDIAIFVGYKVFRRTKWKDPKDVDLVTGLREVELHEQNFYEEMQRENRLDDEGKIIMNWRQKIGATLFGSEL